MTEADVERAAMLIRSRRAADEWLETFDEHRDFVVAQLHFRLRKATEGGTTQDFDIDAEPATEMSIEMAREMLQFVVDRAGKQLAELGVIR